MNCNEAIEILLKPDHNRQQAALTYIRNHPDCLARIDQLARTIVTTVDDELPCAEAQVHLADYYTRQQAHNDAAKLFPRLHTHLNRCPYCQAEYSALAEMMTTLEQGELPTLTSFTPLDLGFLEELPPIWSIDGMVRKLTRQLTVTVTKTRAILESFSLQLTPDVYVTAMRGDDDIHYAVLAIPDETATLRFHFDIRPTPSSMADVTLNVTQSTTNQPVADVRIALRKADGTLVTRSLTDSTGTLTLPQMGIGDYIIQARNDDDLWEIPLSIVSE